MKRIRALARLAAWAAVLIAFRLIFPERPLDSTGPRAVADLAFALGLTLLVLWIARMAGDAILRRVRPVSLRPLERVVLSHALGLTTLATGLTLLAFGGLLRGAWMVSWLATLGILGALDDHVEAWSPRAWLRRLRSWWVARSPVERLALGVGALLLLPVLFMALSPPWDYDGLMYHLEAPRIFLTQGRVTLLPDLWQANGPLSIEMIYALGLGLGSEVFAKLLHLAFGFLLVLGCTALGNRVLGGGRGALAGLALLGLPTLPFWASAAYTDVAWAALETLTILALLAWLDDGREGRWLVLAGLLAGGALGTKYLALLLLPSALVVLPAAGRRPWTAVLRDALLFITPALVLASPWYLKNLILAGNPVYPLVWGGPGWPADRLALLGAYLQSFGLGRAPLDMLLLPLRIFLQPTAFGTFARGNELPSYLFLLAPFYAFFRPNRAAHVLAAIVVVRWFLWAAGSQQTRFLLPAFPLLAVLCSSVLHGLGDRWRGRRVLRALPTALAATSAILVFILTAAVVAALGFHGVVLGSESKRSFLRRVVGDYAALEYVRLQLPASARVQMMWDGQGFYCGAACLPDAEQSRWTWYALRSEGSVDAVARALSTQGVTHLLYSLGDAAFMLEHDAGGVHRRALQFFTDSFRPACTQRVYADPRVEIYALTCSGGA